MKYASLSSKLNAVLNFTRKQYSAGTHNSENPVKTTPTDRVHLTCACVDGLGYTGGGEFLFHSLGFLTSFKICNFKQTAQWKKIFIDEVKSIKIYWEEIDQVPVPLEEETKSFTILLIGS